MGRGQKMDEVGEGFRLGSHVGGVAVKEGGDVVEAVAIGGGEVN